MNIVAAYSPINWTQATCDVFNDALSSFIYGRHQWGCWTSGMEWGLFNRLGVKWRASFADGSPFPYFSRDGEGAGDTQALGHFFVREPDGWYVIADYDISRRPHSATCGIAHGPFRSMDDCLVAIGDQRGKLLPLERALLARLLWKHQLGRNIDNRYDADNFIYPGEHDKLAASAIGKLSYREALALCPHLKQIHSA